MSWLTRFFRRSSLESRLEEKKQRNRTNRRAVTDLMFTKCLSQGEAVAEATDGASLVDGKQTWEHAQESKHDIEMMKRCCDAEIRTFKKLGQSPAPYYFWRVAVLSSKEKNYEQEVQYLETYTDMTKAEYSREDMTLEEAIEKRVLSARVCDIFDRLPKAKNRLKRQQQKELHSVE